jgi:SAM-dependent methyltransferase
LKKARLVRVSEPWKDRITYYNTTYGERIRKNDLPKLVDEELMRASQLVQPGYALDIGCGLGRNTLHLAQNGFQVKAVDRSEVAIKYLQLRAQSDNLPIQAIHANILRIRLEQEFCLVNASFVMDEFDRTNAYWLVQRMQEVTIAGGVHSIITCAEGTPRKQRAEFRAHLFREDELVDLYVKEGWIVVSQTTRRQLLQNEWTPLIRMIVQRPIV